MTEIHQRVVNILTEGKFTTATPQPHDTLESDLGLDSLDTVEFVLDIEREFKLDISDEIIEKWITVEDVVNTVSTMLAGKKA